MQQEQVKTAVKVEDITDIELLEDRLAHIENDIGILYAAADKMFTAKDKGVDAEITTEMRLLTDIGMRAAAMKICCNKIRAQVEVLKDLESEENNV